MYQFWRMQVLWLRALILRILKRDKDWCVGVPRFSQRSQYRLTTWDGVVYERIKAVQGEFKLSYLSMNHIIFYDLDGNKLDEDRFVIFRHTGNVKIIKSLDNLSHIDVSYGRR